MKNNELRGKVFVVTGAASGIGAACARLLAQRGAAVIIADRDEVAGKRVAQELGEAAVAIGVDIADVNSVAALADAAPRQFGPIDGLVACAGIMPSHVDFAEDIRPEQWDRFFDVNVRGTFSCVSAFGKDMARRGRGSIVAIASVTGSRSTPLHAYGCSKAAVIQMVRNLASEWGRSGVRINSISPGYVRTEGLQHNIDHGHRDASRIRESSALGRIVEPRELAAAVSFLLSDEASAITGVDLPVDAGWLAAATWTFYGGLRPSVVTSS